MPLLALLFTFGVTFAQTRDVSHTLHWDDFTIASDANSKRFLELVYEVASALESKSIVREGEQFCAFAGTFIASAPTSQCRPKSVSACGPSQFVCDEALERIPSCIDGMVASNRTKHCISREGSFDQALTYWRVPGNKPRWLSVRRGVERFCERNPKLEACQDLRKLREKMFSERILVPESARISQSLKLRLNTIASVFVSPARAAAACGFDQADPDLFTTPSGNKIRLIFTASKQPGSDRELMQSLTMSNTARARIDARLFLKRNAGAVTPSRDALERLRTADAKSRPVWIGQEISSRDAALEGSLEEMRESRRIHQTLLQKVGVTDAETADILRLMYSPVLEYQLGLKADEPKPARVPLEDAKFRNEAIEILRAVAAHSHAVIERVEAVPADEPAYEKLKTLIGIAVKDLRPFSDAERATALGAFADDDAKRNAQIIINFVNRFATVNMMRAHLAAEAAIRQPGNGIVFFGQSLAAFMRRSFEDACRKKGAPSTAPGRTRQRS